MQQSVHLISTLLYFHVFFLTFFVKVCLPFSSTDWWMKKFHENVFCPSAKILLLCGSFNYPQCEKKPKQISNGPKVSILLWFWTRQKVVKVPLLSKNVLIICETFLWETDLMTVRQLWRAGGRSPDVQINLSCREWWECRDSGWEGRHGSRFTCSQPAVSQLHMLQSTAINPSQLTLVCHKLTVPAWPFVTWNYSQHGTANTDSEFTWLLTPLWWGFWPLYDEARRLQLSMSL